MRLRSLLAFLIISFASLGLVGCGSSGDGVDFVSTGPVAAPTTGNLTFNFVTPQSFNVGTTNTNTLLFQFFNAGNATAVFSSTDNFATSVTVNNIPTSVTTVIITGFDANNIPLFTITQAIAVQGGATAVVPGLSAATVVTLTNLRVAPGNAFDLASTLTSLSIEAGGTAQVFLFGEYSNGSAVLLGNQATYVIPAAGAGVASVDANGLVTAIAPGTTELLISFGGQTLPVPLTVLAQGAQVFASIAVLNTPVPIPLTSGTPVQIVTSGTTGGGLVFGLNPAVNFNYAVDDTTNFAVDAAGMVSVNAGVTAGTTATVTVTYTNADTSTRTATVGVVAQ